MILKRVPKYCWIARSFGNDIKEAKRQLPIWKGNVGRTIGSDVTVHLYHSQAKGWAIVLCSPDYKPRKR
jgi:hypothetical protein